MSSLIGLASIQAPPPNGAASASADEAPGHRLVEPARGGGAAHAALDLLLGRGGRPGDAVRARQRRRLGHCRARGCGRLPRRCRPGRRRRGASGGTRDRPVARRRAKPSAVEDRRCWRSAAMATPPSVSAQRRIVVDVVAPLGGCAGARPPPTPRRRRCSSTAASRSRARRRGTPDRRRARSAGAHRWQGRASGRCARSARDRNRRIRSARRWSSSDDARMLAAHDAADVVDARHRRRSRSSSGRACRSCR